MTLRGGPLPGAPSYAAALEDDADLAGLVRRGVTFAQTLPPK